MRWLIAEGGNGLASLLLVASAATLGCGGGGDGNRHTGKHDIWFMGAVVDGATGAQVNTYDITLVWGNSTVKGKVDAATHRYTLGPLQAWNDYGVLIESDGYRHFSSYNAGISPPTLGANSTTSDIYSSDTTQTFNFDASLFPTAVAPPDITISVIETGTTPHPASGNIRLQPTSQPTIVSQPSEILGQSWTNDGDLYAAALGGPFTNGTYTATAANLVYGVSYAVTVYGVEGYQPSTSNATTQVTVQAGVNTAATVLINPQTVPPLQLASNTISMCRAPVALTDTSAAVVTLTFNEAVEDATGTVGAGPEALDANLLVSYLLFNMSALAANVSSTAQERGSSFTIAGNVLTLAWNPNVGLVTKGAGDAIRTVSYSGLGSIFLQPPMHPELRTSLSALLVQVTGSSTISCAAP
jgi:hypothetical protein